MKFGLEVLKGRPCRSGMTSAWACACAVTVTGRLVPRGHEANHRATALLDFIGVSGLGLRHHNTLVTSSNMSYPPEPFLLARQSGSKVPVLHAPEHQGPERATRILEGGYVDMVSMTRAHIADRT